MAGNHLKITEKMKENFPLQIDSVHLMNQIYLFRDTVDQEK